jgi:hypothetical protein
MKFLVNLVDYLSSGTFFFLCLFWFPQMYLAVGWSNLAETGSVQQFLIYAWPMIAFFLGMLTGRFATLNR